MIINLPKLGPVRFADNLTAAEFRQQVQQLADLYGFEVPKRDVGIGTLLKEGFMRGLGQTGIALGDLFPAMLGSAVGAKDYAQRQMQEAAASQEQLLEKYPPQIGSYKQVGGPYEALQYGAETLGEAGASFLPALIPGVGLGAVGTRLGGQAALRGAMAAGPATPAALAAAKEATAAAGRRAMYGGVYLGSLSQTAPEIFQNIYQETGAMEPGISALAGGIASVLDTIIPGKLLDNLGTYGKLKAIEKVAKDTGAAPKVWKYIASEAAKAAGTEGLTESAQEAIGAAAEQVAGSAKPFFSKENQERFTEAFIKGAIGGSAFGAVGGAGQGLQAQGAYRQEQRNVKEAEQALQAQMEAERAAGTLTPEKQAAYDTAIQTARAQREKELTEAFEGLPEFERQQREAAMLPEDLKAFSARAQQTQAMKDLDAWVQKAKAELEASRQKLDEEKAASSIFSERGPTPRTGGLYSPKIEQQREERRERRGEAQRGLRSFAFGEPTPEEFAAQRQQAEEARRQATQEKRLQQQVATRQFAFEPEPSVPTLDTVTKIDDPKAFGKLFGIGPTARILRADGLLAGKDISKPEDAAVVKQVLEAYASANPAQGAAAKIEEFLKRPEFGGTGAARTDAAPSGVSTEVAGQSPAGAAPGTADTSERGGVADTAPPAGGTEAATEGEPGAVDIFSSPEAFAAAIVANDPRTSSPEGIQFYSNNAEAVEAALQKTSAAAKEKTDIHSELTDGTQTTKTKQTKAQGQKAPAAPAATPAAPEVESTTPEVQPSGQFSTLSDAQPTAADEKSIADLLAVKPRKLDRVAKAAHTYFSRIRVGLAIKEIANDLVYQPVAYSMKPMESWFIEGQGTIEPRYATEAEADFFRGKGGATTRRAREWIRANLSPEINQQLDAYVDAYTKEASNSADMMALFKRLQEVSRLTDQQMRDMLDNKGNLPASKSVARLHTSAHPAVLEVLRNGDLSGALALLANHLESPFFSRVGQVLAPLLKNTKVAIGPESYFDPNTNTVYLRDGATIYEVLHEATHAAVSHVIANPSHPLTKQLADIFKAVRGSVDGAYGASNLQEFVAEIWSNQDFRNSLRGIMPNGQKQTLWSRFLNALRRWFGFPAKQDTVVDRVDRLIMEMLDAPPAVRKGEPLFAQAITQPNLASTLLNKAGNAISSSSVMNSQRASEWLGKFGNLGATARQQAYRLMPMYAYAEVASKVLGPAAKKFSATLESMEGYQAQLLEAAQPLNRRLMEFTQDPQFEKWSKLVHESTIPDVRPYPESKKLYVGSPEKTALWVELNRRFEALTPEAQKLFRDLFASYKKLDKELETSLKNNIFGNVDDPVRAASAYEKILLELASIRIDHYAPLFREGPFWVQYELNGVILKPSFDSAAERDYAIRQLEAQGATNIESFSRVEDITSKNIPDGTMLAAIVKIMQKTGAGQDAIDQLTNLVVKALPETSILKRRQYREGVPGYIENAAYAYSRVSSASAQQLARMRYGVELQNSIKEMIEEQRKLRGNESALGKEMIDEFSSRRSFAMSPNLSSWSRYASAGAYYFNIAGNVSSAVVQTLQTPMVTMPYLGAEYGYVKAGKALLSALNLYRTSGFNRKVQELSGETTERQAMLSIENLLGRNLGEVEQLRPLIEALKNRGLLQTSTLHEALQSERDPEGRQLFKGTSRLHDIANFITNGMFHHSERMNREISAVAAYTLEMQNPKNTGTEAERQQRAIEKAIKTVQYTHGASGFLSGPSIAQNDLGRVFTVFKRFAFSMYYMLFDTIFRSLPKANATDEQKQEIDAARRQLVGIYGMAALFAGAKGVPLYWVAELAYNMFQGEDDDDFDAVMRKFLGDFLYKGPINYLTNLSIADRVGWSDLIFREAKGDKADASFLSRALESALGAPYSMIDSMFRAKDLVAEGHLERGIEMALPVALRNVLKGSRYFTEGANTLRGDPVMGEISGYNSAMQVLGFAPANLIRQYEENAYEKTRDKALTGEVNKQLKRYYAALREGDVDGMQEAREKLFAFSDKHGLGLTEDTITKSVKSRDKISAEMYTNHGISVSNRNRAAIERAVAEFE